MCVLVLSRSVVSNSLQPYGLLGWAPLSMGFSTQEYWSGLAFPSPGDLPNLETEPVSLMSPASAGMFLPIRITWEARSCAQKADTVTCHLFALKPQAKGSPRTSIQ